MSTLNIAVSGINATDNPGPGIPVARSLRECSLACNIYGLSYDVNDPGHYLDVILDGTIILPHPSGGWNAIAEKLVYLKKKKGLDIIIPCLDAELPIFIKHQQELDKLGIKTLLPSEEQFLLRNKENLGPLAEKIGIAYPQTYKITSNNEFNNSLTAIAFPTIIKGLYYKAYYVYNIPDLKRYFQEIVGEWGYPVLIQKIVYGEELNVVGVGDGEGGVLGMVAIKKQTTTKLGKIWSGITINHESLLSAARKFVQISKWKGPFELECIVNGEAINLIEINPRFPAWVYFATGVGINLPERLIRFVEKQEFKHTDDYPVGKVFMRYTQEVISDIHLLSDLVVKGEHYYEAS